MQKKLTRRQSLLTALSAGGLALAGGTAAARPVASAEGSLWRGMQFQDQDGGTFQLGHGAPVALLTMWAHWCPICVGELSAWTSMAAAIGPKVDVVLVSHPAYWADDLTMARRRGLRMRMVTPVAANGDAAVRAALTTDGAYEVPRSLALRASDGSVAWRQFGAADWASAGMLTAVRALAG